MLLVWYMKIFFEKVVFEPIVIKWITWFQIKKAIICVTHKQCVCVCVNERRRAEETGSERTGEEKGMQRK